MFNLELALRPFKDPRVLAKAGVVFGLYAISSVLQFMLNLAISVTEMVPVPVNQDTLSLFSSLTTLLCTFIISILMFPVTLYLSGYTYSIANRIRTNVSEALPDHTDIIDRIKLGMIAVSFNVILTTPIVFFIIFVLLILGLMSGQDTSSFLQFAVHPGVLAGFITMMLFVGMYLLIVNSFMVPIFMYRYLLTHSIAQSLRVDAFINVLRISWLDWVIVFLFSIMLTSLSTGIMLVLCCIGPLISPMISTISLLATAGLTGAVYHKIELGMQEG